jgi:hypothetical protein
LINNQGVVDIAFGEEAITDVLHNATADPRTSIGFNARTIFSIIHLDIAESSRSVLLDIIEIHVQTHVEVKFSTMSYTPAYCPREPTEIPLSIECEVCTTPKESFYGL